jgi:hypothetical protein
MGQRQAARQGLRQSSKSSPATRTPRNRLRGRESVVVKVQLDAEPVVQGVDTECRALRIEGLELVGSDETPASEI